MKRQSFAALIAAMLAIAVLSSGHVDAHAEYDRSIPESGATIQGAPVQVELWFTEEIAEGSTIAVVDASGTSATAADAELDLYDPDRKHLTVELKPNLPNGVYTVTWTSISAEDGDSDSDIFTFTIEGSGTPVASPVASPVATPGAATSATPPPTSVSGNVQAPPVAEPADIDDRALGIAVGAGVLVALGIYGFWRLVRPRRHPFDRNPG